MAEDTVAEATSSTLLINTPADPPKAGDEAAQPSHRDWNRLAQGMRETNDAVKAALAALAAKPAEAIRATKVDPAPADAAMVEISKMRAELAFRDALDTAGVADPKQRTVLQKMWKADAPADVGAWLQESVELTGFKKLAVVPPATPPIAPSNTGAPAANAATDLPANPLEWPPGVVEKMSTDDFRKALTNYRASAGRGNPFLAQRRR